MVEKKRAVGNISSKVLCFTCLCYTKIIMRYVYSFLMGVCLLGALLFGSLSYVIHNQVIDFSVLANYSPHKSSVVLDDAGEILCCFELDRREFVPLSDVPVYVQQAFIAAEDHDFFNHPGISLRSIVRSIVVNLYHMRKMQGASTITQQLVKLLFFDNKKTFSRKIKEQVYALLIELQFTKEHILETYLNHICFGCGIYGIEAAAQRFWGIHAAQLSVAQGATLAAIVNYPARYCPLVNAHASRQRRNHILAAMQALNFIDQVLYKQAKNEPLVLTEQRQQFQLGHIKEAVRIFLEELLGRHTLYTGGLVIQTTLNKKIQECAQNNFKQRIDLLRKELGLLDGALLTIDSSTGGIKALVGGYNFKESQYNRALQAQRQMGSLFKPIVYAVAIAQGRSFIDIEVDEPIEFGDGANLWCPHNSTDTFEGPMTLARALSFSNNIIAIKTLLRCGIDSVVALAREMHISNIYPSGPSLALGCVDVKVKEVAATFNVFANDGIYVEPHLISWVKNEWGSKIYRWHDSKSVRVLDSRVVGQVTKVLSIGINRYLDRFHVADFTAPAICKTGTTNDSRTCWFAGSTPHYTTVIYVGRDNNQPLGKNVYPIWTAFPVWLALHRAIDGKEGVFRYDPSLREVCVNWVTGKPANKSDPESVALYI